MVSERDAGPGSVPRGLAAFWRPPLRSFPRAGVLKSVPANKFLRLKRSHGGTGPKRPADQGALPSRATEAASDPVSAEAPHAAPSRTDTCLEKGPDTRARKSNRPKRS